MAGSSPGTGRLAVVLAFFFVFGTAMALFIWHTLSDFLAGHPVDGGQYLIAMALIGVFVGFAWLMARYIQLAVPPYPGTDESDPMDDSEEASP